MRRGRLVRDKCQLEVIDDPVHRVIVCDEGDDAHPAPASRTDQGVDFENLADHLGPEPAGDSLALLLNEDEGMLVGRVVPCAPCPCGRSRIGRSTLQ